MHRDIGHALAAAGAPVAAVAEHFLRGECRGDPVALDWLHRAVEEATVRAPATAAELLESTLELVDADDPGRDRLLAELVVVLLVSSQPEQAERVCLDLLTRAQTPITEVRLRMALAQLASSRGELDEALEQAARAEPVDGLSPHQRARLLGASSVLALSEPRLDVASAMATRSLRVAEEVGGAVARANSAYTLGRVAYYRGRFDDALSWFDQCRITGDDEPSGRIVAGWQHLRCLADLFGVLVLLQAGRADLADAPLAHYRRLTLERGYKELYLRTCWLQAIGSFLAGRWDDAAGQLEEVEGLLDGSRPGNEMLATARGLGVLIAIHRGDAGHAERIPILPAIDVDDSDWPALAAGLRAEADGAPAAALEVLAAAWREDRGDGGRRPATVDRPRDRPPGPRPGRRGDGARPGAGRGGVPGGGGAGGGQRGRRHGGGRRPALPGPGRRRRRRPGSSGRRLPGRGPALGGGPGGGGRRRRLRPQWPAWRRPSASSTRPPRATSDSGRRGTWPASAPPCGPFACAATGPPPALAGWGGTR